METFGGGEGYVKTMLGFHLIKSKKTWEYRFVIKKLFK